MMNTILIHEGKITEQNLSADFSDVVVRIDAGVLDINVPENKVINEPLMFIHTGDAAASFEIAVKIAAYGVLNISQMIMGEGDLTLDINVALVGSAAASEVRTVALASGSQQNKIAVKIENLAPHTTANIVNHGVVKDRAHLAIDGTGKIHKGMKGSDAQQETRLLNLSKDASATANPFLLIDEGDITAGHAASIGQIDEAQIYYLMSRGMSKADAEKLIVSGFLMPFVDLLEDEVLREQLTASIERKLG